MSWLFPRGTRRLPPIWVDDVPESVKVEAFDNLTKELLKRPLRYTNVGGFNMHNNKEELMKELINKRANDEIESDPLVTKPIWENDMLIDHIKNSVERKRSLMRLEKEHLVDMVFNLESRNETLVNNLSEVEKMYTKLKDRVDELETEVFSLRNQNKLWECIAEGYKKKEQEEKKND